MGRPPTLSDLNVSGALNIAEFGGGLRGLRASRDIHAGDILLRIPTDTIVGLQRASVSNIGGALKALGPLPEDWILLVFTLVDSLDEDSPHLEIWKIVPRSLSTGLSCSTVLVDALQGTAAYEDLRSAREHVEEGYQRMKPLLNALVQAYPNTISASQLSYSQYLWAVQLWYSYAMQVELEPGVFEQCLVPAACLLNHHAQRPHIREYGRVDRASDSLLLRAAEECAMGEQIYLSYGRLSNWHLLIFYGFAVPDNPHDRHSLKVARNGIEICLELALGVLPDVDDLGVMFCKEEDGPCTCNVHEQLAEALKRDVRVLREAYQRIEVVKTDTSCSSMCTHALTCVQAEIDICEFHLERCMTLALHGCRKERQERTASDHDFALVPGGQAE